MERKRSISSPKLPLEHVVLRERPSIGRLIAQACTWKTVRTIAKAVIFLLAAISVFIGLHELFPEAAITIKESASWAKSTGLLGMTAFSFGAGMMLLIPGVPGSLLCFTCGAVFPFKTGLVIAAFGHHIGACVAFLISRNLVRGRFEKLLASRPRLKAMSKAAKLEQWKVTFLSRFIVMPVQLKNYIFGVLPVSFKCFFSMAFLGDLQSTFFSVYLGSISKDILFEVHESNKYEIPANRKTIRYKKLLGAITLITAVTMTTIASVVARRAYRQVLEEVEDETGSLKERMALMESRDENELERNDLTNGIHRISTSPRQEHV